MAYVRTVRTASGATAVQIVHSSHRGSRDIEHIGSAHDEAELEVLKAAARARMAAGQGELDLGLDDSPEAGGPLEIISSRMGHLWDALSRAFDALGFDAAVQGDGVFRRLVLARGDRADQQAGQPAGARRSRDRRGVLSDGEPSPARLRDRAVAPRAGGGVRGAREPGPGQPGAV